MMEKKGLESKSLFFIISVPILLQFSFFYTLYQMKLKTVAKIVFRKKIIIMIENQSFSQQVGSMSPKSEKKRSNASSQDWSLDVTHTPIHS